MEGDQMSLRSYWLTYNARKEPGTFIWPPTLFSFVRDELDAVSKEYGLTPRELNQSDDWFRFRIVADLQARLITLISQPYRVTITERIGRLIGVERESHEHIVDHAKRQLSELQSWRDEFLKWQESGGGT
jgi:hypothetical protein